ncbi:MAG: dTDP-4-dehydrorhamnose reductase [Pseudomonadota bacterium]
MSSLRKEASQLSFAYSACYLIGMDILLFGKDGQVARSLQEEAGSVAVTALGSAECNLLTPGAGATAIAGRSPDVIINAAAYTAVDKAEEERDAAQRLNADAPVELARAAKDAGAVFIHISTDYVFNGADEHAYSEQDETAPLNHYGDSKRAGEEGILDLNSEAVILRTSWVFSEFGANFVKTMLRLGAERDQLSIVDDQIGGPTPARDIARTLLTIAGKKHRGAPGDGVYHFQGRPSVSWAAFAEKIFEIAGLKTGIEKISTAAYPTPASRPLNTVLDCARIERDFGLAAPDWRIGLRAVIAALTKTDN